MMLFSRIFAAFIFLNSLAQAGLLPGGVVNPALDTAAAVNPAVLAEDWETNLSLLYAPPADATIPHRFLTSFTYANSSGYGFSGGYNGSAYQGTGLHSGFAGGGYKFGNFALGTSVDFPDLGTGFSPRLNLGTHWKQGERRQFSIVAYDVAGNLRVGAGVGLVYSRRYSLEVGVLSPGLAPQGPLGDELALTVAGSYYWWQGIGVSLGSRYWLDASGKRLFSWNAGAVLTINERVVLTAQYTSDPSAIIVGAMIGYFPDGGDRQNNKQTKRMKTITK